MKASLLAVLTLPAISLCAVPGATAGMVLTHAAIYTVDQNLSWAQALAFDDDGVIVAVGDEKQVLSAADPSWPVIDLQQRMVLPGFQDVHLHAIEAGMNADVCLFDAFDSLQGYLDTVADCAASTPGDQWVLGANVNMVNLLAESNNPLAELDAIEFDRPVLILDDIGHGAWANSVALAAVGFNTIPDAPDGNIILRDDQGKPNGVVYENAPHALRTAAYPPTAANLAKAQQALLSSVAVLNQNGITSVSDAGGYWPQGHHRVWDRAEAAEQMTVRASNALYLYPDKPLDAQVEELISLFHNDPARLVRFNQVKIYVDGILSQATGALIDPYEAHLQLEGSEARGFLYFEEAQLMKAARKFSQAGFQLHFHVTGDRGARLALDAIAQANPDSGPHRLTHLYLVHEDDIPRFAQLGVVADIQLAPSAMDPAYEEFMAEFIGERAKRLVPAGELVAADALVTLSSDWDADELNPMIKIAAAVQRANNGLPDVATAIEAMTINPAILLQHDERTGSVEVGKFADLVILGENILRIPLADVADTPIEATVFQGEIVHDANRLFSR